MLPIVVIGGGPAGSVCARQLALRGHAVVLFERLRRPLPRPAETCSPRVRRLVEETCGAFLPTHAVTPLEYFWSSWGGKAWENHRFGFWQLGDGVIVERTQLDDWLLRLAEKAGVVVHRGYRVEGGCLFDNSWIVYAKNAENVIEMQACFVIEATGARSRSPVLTDTTRIYTDKQVCVSAELLNASSRQSVAGVEAAPDGWWFTAGRADGFRTTSFFTDADALPRKNDRATWFLAALRRTTHVKKHTVFALSPKALKTMTARTSIRRLLWKGSWLAIGDAARTVDPLSGGGIGRAVEDAVEGAAAVSYALIHSDTGPLRLFAINRVVRQEEQWALQLGIYAWEDRWATHTFWRRRVSPPQSLSGAHSLGAMRGSW